MLRDIPVLVSAADLPLVAWSQRPDTLPTQMSPRASAIFVVSLCRKSFPVLAILAWIAATRRALFARWATTSSASYLANTREFSNLPARGQHHAVLKPQVDADAHVPTVRLGQILDHDVARGRPARTTLT
jgi:hypothetical protein